MASLYPAKALGISDRLGIIMPGYTASFVALDNQGNITRTWINGEAY